MRGNCQLSQEEQDVAKIDLVDEVELQYERVRRLAVEAEATRVTGP